MPVTVKNIVLWRKEAESKTGVLAQTLEPFASAGSDLQLVMGYRYRGNETKAAIELYPITAKKLTAAAEGAGLGPSSFPVLLVEGDNKPGLGREESGRALSHFRGALHPVPDFPDFPRLSKTTLRSLCLRVRAAGVSRR